MSVRVMADVWDNGPKDATECMILLALANFADDKGGNCYPGNERLAQMARCTERTVTARIKTLTEGGWIAVESRGVGRGQTSSYRLNISRLKVEAGVTTPSEKVEADVTEKVKLTPKKVKLTTEKVEADDTPLREPSVIHQNIHQENHQSSLPLDVGFTLPDWVDPVRWKAWEEHRRKIRFAMTDYARSLLIKKLDGFRSRGIDPNFAIDYAIEKGWRGFFEPPAQEQPRPGGIPHGRPQFATAQERKNEAHAQFFRERRERLDAANGGRGVLGDSGRTDVHRSVPTNGPARFGHPERILAAAPAGERSRGDESAGVSGRDGAG